LSLPTVKSHAVFDPAEQLALLATGGEAGAAVETLPTVGREGSHDTVSRSERRDRFLAVELRPFSQPNP
jgi:hypothetical protein